MAGSPLISPFYRVRDYLHVVRMLVEQTGNEVQAMRVELAGHLTRLEGIASSQLAQLERLSVAVEALSSSRDVQHAQLVEILRFVHSGVHGRRLELRELRASDAYARAFTDPDPLVSVVISTYDNYELLRERAIPSVLEQTHRNFELVVVGDAASDESRVAVESFGDPRLSFFNLPYRGPYPDEPEAAGLVSGVPARNEAVRRAQGAWIAPLDDDDAFRPYHIERLLAGVRERELELCLGQHCQHWPDGTEQTHGRFPPVRESFNGLRSAIYYAGLGDIFEHELADAAFGLPHDWAFCLRMMEAGVRVGMLDEATVDHYPATLRAQHGDGDPLGSWVESEPQ